MSRSSKYVLKESNKWGLHISPRALKHSKVKLKSAITSPAYWESLWFKVADILSVFLISSLKIEKLQVGGYTWVDLCPRDDHNRRKYQKQPTSGNARKWPDGLENVSTRTMTGLSWSFYGANGNKTKATKYLPHGGKVRSLKSFRVFKMHKILGSCQF